MGMTNFDDAPRIDRRRGHLQGTWTRLGEAAGSVGVGVRRIEIDAGGWSTPAHEHGLEEEIFYILAGRGFWWQAGSLHEIRAGDCIVARINEGAHSVCAVEPIDMLVYGPRCDEETLVCPRISLAVIANRVVVEDGSATIGGVIVEGLPVQFVREAALGPPELGSVAPRPSTIVNVADVEGKEMMRPRIARTRRNLGVAAGSVSTGLQHVTVVPGKLSAPLHCHSVEEELFVVLDGTGELLLDDEATPVRAGDVISCLPGTGVSHTFRGGDGGLTYLAYGTRSNADICFYPRSSKLLFGVHVTIAVEDLDYWEGED